MKQRKFYIFSLVIFFFPSLSAHAEPELSNILKWQNIEKGLDFARYTLGPEEALLRSEVLLLKISPEFFSFDLSIRKEAPRVDNVKNLTKASGALAGINANFFDPKNKPLGILIKDARILQNMHRQGNVLTGVFSIDSTGPKIEYRDLFSSVNKLLALQAGPRLIEDGKVLKLSSPEVTSRRSGVALTRKNEVILYVTLLRFPGASLLEIQHMLIQPELEIKDALNLDGGGSSQFYLDKIGSLSEEINISGGDDVPVALVIKRK